MPTAPLTLENFVKAWAAAPFARYFLNTVLLVTMILGAQLVLCTLAAYAFARFDFAGRDGGVPARPGAAHDPARRAHRRELPHDEPARPARHPRARSVCPTWPRPSASSFSDRRSRRCRRSWTRPRAWKARARSRCCGASTCRSRGPSTSPTGSSRSATTGTTSSGRSSSPTRCSRDRSPWASRSSPPVIKAWTGRSSRPPRS